MLRPLDIIHILFPNFVLKETEYRHAADDMYADYMLKNVFISSYNVSSSRAAAVNIN